MSPTIYRYGQSSKVFASSSMADVEAERARLRRELAATRVALRIAKVNKRALDISKLEGVIRGLKSALLNIG